LAQAAWPQRLAAALDFRTYTLCSLAVRGSHGPSLSYETMLSPLSPHQDSARTGAMGGNRKGPTGIAFQTNFGDIGGTRRSVFGPEASILDEEKRLIEKVFSIVDRDNSGTIDVAELGAMFELFGVDTNFLNGAVQRIMQNVDKDRDGQISPAEFYQLLSQKFEKGDPRSEIDTVFHRFDKKHDGVLDADELLEVGTMLGENLTLADTKEMIRNFKTMYLAAENAKTADDWTNKPTKAAVVKQSAELNKDNLTLTQNEFYFIMQEEL